MLTARARHDARTADGRAISTPTTMATARRRRHSTATVGLLLLSVLAGPARALDLAARRVHDQRLELFRFVLHRDAAWRLVLDQRIKLTASYRTLYDWDASVDADVRARLRLVDEDAAMVAPLPVIQSVVHDFSWLGSHVEYAARVLRRAFSCVVHVHVSHVIEILEALELKTKEALMKKAAEEQASATGGEEEAEAERPLAEEARKELEEELDDRFAHDVEPFRLTFREAWAAISMLADKLAVVGGRLNVMADLSNLISKALVTREVIPFQIIKAMRRKIDEMIDRRCDRHQPKQVYLELGFREVQGKPMGRMSTPEGLKLSIGRLTKRLFAFYNSLQIENIVAENWAQVFNYQIANMKDVKLRSMVDEMIEQHWDDQGEKRKREVELKVLEEFTRDQFEIEKSLD